MKFKNFIFIGGFLAIFCIFTLFAFNFVLPERVYITAGRAHEFNYAIPVRLKVEGETIGAMSVNNEKVDGNIEINLDKPFTVQLDSDGVTNVDVMLGMIPLKTVEVCVLPDIKIIPSGKTVGVTLKTTGVLVLGTGTVNTENQQESEPAKGILQSGDIIMEANGISLEKKEDLITAVDTQNGDAVSLKIKRSGEVKDVQITPAKSSLDNTYKLGIWVRDSTQGIGTVTYYNPNDNTFGALGHGVYDVDTRELMTLKEGTITASTITGIKKGEKGSPGELMGTLEKEDVLGAIQKNTEYGLYGEADPKQVSFFGTDSLPIATKNQVEEGPAQIITTLDNNTTQTYNIEIETVNRLGQSPDKGMVICITDPVLLEKTNGIVQGMSGSPIIQNGKIIGAVTHVFVKDPTKGYGIFIENMLSQ